MKKSNFILYTLLLSLMLSFFIPLRSHALEYPVEYKELLIEIRDAVENKELFQYPPSDLRTQERIKESDLSQAAKSFFLSTSFITHVADLSVLCYSVRDLDGNGIPELLFSSPVGQLWSVFSLQQNSPVMVQEFWPRNSGMIYGNYLYNIGSGGAGYTTYNYCVLENNIFAVIDGYKYIEGTLYDIHDNKISKTKANEIDAKYQKLEAPQWHMLIPGMFTDVDYSSWYSEPVIWATEKGVTKGTSEIEFSPDASCTRAQMVTFLWRSQGCPEPKHSASSFNDVSADAYYYKAVLWALDNSITTGTSEHTFSPNATVTRAQTVTFLWRANNKPIVNCSNQFSDLDTTAYYYNAVLWAISVGITKGISDTTFSPDGPCTRAQIVTFLYRAMCPDRFRLDISDFIGHMTRLISALDMQKATPWRYGTDLISFPGLYSYSHDGLFYEYYGQKYTIKNESNKQISFYGTHLGDNKSEYVSAFESNGWISMGDHVSEYENITSYGTIINGVKYYIQLNMDANDNVFLWYFGPWDNDNGEYDEFYGQFG